MATELSSVIKSLKHLENQNSSHKPQPRREDCQEEITEKNSPDTYNREKALMKKLRNINDSDYVIPRCPSFLVFCPDPAELSSPTIPAAVKAQVPFFRLWCLHQIYLALISNGVNIVVKCGHHKIRGATRGSSSAYFIPNRAFLEAVLNTVDIFSEGAVAFNSDKKVLMD
eukprot:gene30259-40215_t